MDNSIIDDATRGWEGASASDAPGARSEDADSTQHRPADNTMPPVPEPTIASIPYISLGQPTAIWPYRSASGQVIGATVRFDPPGKKKKVILPLAPVETDGAWRWKWKGFWSGKKLLYGLEKLAKRPEAPVLIVEGEKTTDAAQELFPEYVVVTWGGTGMADTADLSPLANRKEIVIWPDHDEDGQEAVEKIANRLVVELNLQSVKLVAVPGTLEEGWDLADKIPEGMDVRALVADAPEFEVMDNRVACASEAEEAPDHPGTALNQAVAGEAGGHGRRQANILIDLAQPAKLFHTPDRAGFADLVVNGHRETWPIRSEGFRLWLTHHFYKATGGAPASEALQTAMNGIEAKARFDGPERKVHVRVGSLDDRLFLDLCDNAWRAVEIDANGWRVVDNPPVRFRRFSSMKPIPAPAMGGSIKLLRPFLNVQSEADFVLVVAWALACLRDHGPYPVLALAGEQGSAKSTFAAMLRALLDPSIAPLRTLPREDRDLFIAASRSHLLVFDNVSSLPSGISDTLCRLATGGGLATRQLYSDQDEVVFEATRPIILNGIEEIVTRGDLADRAMLLTLEAISEESRRSEQELWAAFDADCPRILGALLDAVVMGLKMLPNTKLERLPRMADFALWGAACESQLWPVGTFTSAYDGNREAAVEAAIETDAVATVVRALMTARTEWRGTAAELLAELSDLAGETKSKTWPGNPRAMRGALTRTAPFLRKVGIDISRPGREGRKRTRIILITRSNPSALSQTAGGQPSAPSATSALVPKANEANGLPDASLRTVADAADASEDGDGSTVRANALKTKGETGADGADANSPPQSALEDGAWRRWI